MTYDLIEVIKVKSLNEFYEDEMRKKSYKLKGCLVIICNKVVAVQYFLWQIVKINIINIIFGNIFMTYSTAIRVKLLQLIYLHCAYTTSVYEIYIYETCN